MKKSVFLIILFIISFGYLDFVLKVENIKDSILIISWIFGAFGMVYFLKFTNNKLNSFENKKAIYLFFILMFLSSIYPYNEFNQGVLSTLIAQRENYSLLFFFVFLSILPSEEDVIISLRFCTYLSIFLMFISVFLPEFFLGQEKVESLHRRQIYGSTDIFAINTGAKLLFFYFFLSISKTIKNPKFLKVIEIIFIFIIIFLMQNRSRLIFAIPVLFYFLFKLRSKFKFLFLIPIIVTFIVLFEYIIKISENLITESVNQINDFDYNRWQSVFFFLFEFKSNIFTFLFGHGTAANGSQYLAILERAQRERFAFISDIGLFGTFFYYGISFILLISRFLREALKSIQPLYLKLFALFVIFVPTIQGFGVLNSKDAIIYSLFFYLIVFNSSKKEINFI